MTAPSLTILGGGVCGLYAAHTALTHGTHVTVLEKESSVGGLAAGHHLGGNWFDLGVHMLHAFDTEVYATCREAMGPERIEVPLHSKIKWGGRLYHYPLRGRDILAGIPLHTLAHCLAGLFLAEIESRCRSRPLGTDAESALIELYGAPLYQFFFEDFTHRYWGIHPKELSAEFVRRKMPRLSAMDVFKNLLEKLHLAKPRNALEGALRFETLHYSKNGAEALPRCLAKALTHHGARILTDSPVTRVLHHNHCITAVETGSTSYSSDHFISTLPLPQFIDLLHPQPPPEVREAARHLRFKPMTVYALLVRKPRCMDALYTYYRDRSFHRVGEPKNAGLAVTPADHTTLIVETTCEVGDEKWTGQALPQILHDLAAEGLCEPSEVISHHLIHSHHAYPIFSLGFEKHLHIVTAYLARFSNLRSTGRQGAFTFPNMHTAMRMGATAADELIKS